MASIEQARRAVEFARQAAQRANQAAASAARAAERAERLTGSNAGTRDAHVRLAAMQRESEARHRAAERMHLTFARRMVRWAAREDAQVLFRPALMHAVATTAGWQGAVLALGDACGSEMLVAASDATARRAHELEVALAEGPAWDARRGRMLTAVGEEVPRRWPRYGPAVVELGVQAVAAAPIDLGREGLAGSLAFTAPAAPEEAGACGVAEVAAALTQTVLTAPELVRTDSAGVPGLDLFDDGDLQPVLHQAAGMLHVRLGWDIDSAIALIHAHAFAEDLPVAEVAKQVLRGNLLLA